MKMTRKEMTRKLHKDLDYILTQQQTGCRYDGVNVHACQNAVQLVIEGIAGAMRTPPLYRSLERSLSNWKDWGGSELPQWLDDFRRYKTEAKDRIHRPWLYPASDEPWARAAAKRERIEKKNSHRKAPSPRAA